MAHGTRTILTYVRVGILLLMLEEEEMHRIYGLELRGRWKRKSGRVNLRDRDTLQPLGVLDGKVRVDTLSRAGK